MYRKHSYTINESINQSINFSIKNTEPSSLQPHNVFLIVYMHVFIPSYTYAGCISQWNDRKHVKCHHHEPDRHQDHLANLLLVGTFPSLPFPSLPFPSLPFPSLPFPSLPFPFLFPFPFPFLSFPFLSFPFLSFPLLSFPCFVSEKSSCLNSHGLRLSRHEPATNSGRNTHFAYMWLFRDLRQAL